MRLAFLPESPWVTGSSFPHILRAKQTGESKQQQGASLVAKTIKNLPANAGDAGELGLILGLGRYPGVGSGNPLQYSCLENPTDRGAWQATVLRVAKSQLSD